CSSEAIALPPHRTGSPHDYPASPPAPPRPAVEIQPSPALPGVLVRPFRRGRPGQARLRVEREDTAGGLVEGSCGATRAPPAAAMRANEKTMRPWGNRAESGRDGRAE